MMGTSMAIRVGREENGSSSLRTKEALASLAALLPEVEFEARPAACDLCRAVAADDVDCAILGAHDLPEPLPDSLDWCWLPRPEGEAAMALIFRAGDSRLGRIRSLFVKEVTIAGAGAGNEGNCTLACLRALERAEVCLYDSLLDPALLERLPALAKRINVGKRNGAPSRSQAEISHLIADEARKGKRVLRLKGGDPGIFGRLAEEVEMLDSLRLPYRVLPGVSSLAAATTGTGILLTRRGVSNGFCALTPRRAGGGMAPVGREARATLPLVMFMAVELITDLVRELEAEGIGAESPAALVFAAGDEEERVLRGRLGDLAEAARGESRPGLLIIGEVSRHGYSREWGALEGKSVLVACEGAVQAQVVAAITDHGGRAICRPMTRVEVLAEAGAIVDNARDYDWLLFTSPKTARVFAKLLRDRRLSARKLPRIMEAGSGTDLEVAAQGLVADLDAGPDPGPDSFVGSPEAPVERGARILHLATDKDDGVGAEILRKSGATVDEAILCKNHDIGYDHLPEFEAIVFASPDEVESFIRSRGVAALAGRSFALIGSGTAAALERAGIPLRAEDAGAKPEMAIAGLAARLVRRALAGETLASPGGDGHYSALNGTHADRKERIP